MKQRGRLKAWANADITIFDPETVMDNAEPVEGKMTLPSTGIPHVIVKCSLVMCQGHQLIKWLKIINSKEKKLCVSIRKKQQKMISK